MSITEPLKLICRSSFRKVFIKKTQKLRDPFLWTGFNCLKYIVTTRRLFTIYSELIYFWGIKVYILVYNFIYRLIKKCKRLSNSLTAVTNFATKFASFFQNMSMRILIAIKFKIGRKKFVSCRFPARIKVFLVYSGIFLGDLRLRKTGEFQGKFSWYSVPLKTMESKIC